MMQKEISMAEPLKNLYNQEYISRLSQELTSHYSSFASQQFSSKVFDKQWESRELKERMRHIASVIREFLPPEYSESIELLKQVSTALGMEYMFANMIFQDYVEVWGLDEYEVSMEALHHFTQSSSSEFAVRQFILKEPQKSMEYMRRWADDENEHVRRLASEGCRPRLPWAVALPLFKKDPTIVIEILEKLKDDKSEYVRKSVANNLNDISKDNPELVITIAKAWLGENSNRDKLVKHGCRTLLKQSNQEVMRLFGYGEITNLRLENFTLSKSVKIGEELTFGFDLISDKSLGKLRIEYAMEFVRQKNKSSTKVFKIAEGDYTQKQKRFERFYSFKPISTRNYYEGEHKLTIIVNGLVLHQERFMLEGEI
jgi:3-methyladenine DNA glycosylase AlkC